MSQESQPSNPYSAYAIIAKKRDGWELDEQEIKWFIQSLLSGDVASYQMSALLMAIYLRNFNTRETAALTDSMLYSGKTLNFEGLDVIDKHSTGGVGDKASFILAPLAAACGVKVPMMAGRGLGHTGGTVDKIESLPGFKTELSFADFKNQVLKHGLSLIGQTGEIAPADKQIYALRDVTATIESIPLITASIMSKKLAEGAQGIVMDVKTGGGAFMKSVEQARELAQSLRNTASRFERSMMTVISDMDQPLGKAIGNALEIKESIDTLKGEGPADLEELSTHLAGGMVFLAGKGKTLEEGKAKAYRALKSGEGLKYFRQLVENQGGDPTYVDDPDKLPRAEHVTSVVSPQDGYIHHLDCEQFGHQCVRLGGGRKKQEDKIDFAVGLEICHKVGEAVKAGDELVRIHHHAQQKDIVREMQKEFTEKLIQLRQTKPKTRRLIFATEVALSKERQKHG